MGYLLYFTVVSRKCSTQTTLSSMNELVGADKALMYPLSSAFLVCVRSLGNPQLLKVLAIGSTAAVREALNKINAEEKNGSREQFGV